ncbi:MAG: 1,4-alpha-glucan branching protein GlgB [Acholeplasmatales bacterium]|jgi:1,4-alpha-glucan branching enzyme|nr:1,4-alpha-glucan branching protein GlgB [Acholeplasmatales bacterium]
MTGFDSKFISSFLNGRNANLYKLLGAHMIKDINGLNVRTEFLVYAPHANRVNLVGDFNFWNGEKYEMEKIDHNGFYYFCLPYSIEWQTYKFEIITNGKVILKSDPFAFFSERRPQTASIVYDIDGYNFSDKDYLNNRKKAYDDKVLIYECHLGSWRNKYGIPEYNKIVDELIPHLLSNHFTHLELLPIYEYPLDDSWGYQGTGFFSATSRYGTPKDLMYMIDRLHQVGIGVILDVVLGHICKDNHGLYFFDGTPLYEIEDEFFRENLVWGTANLDFGKGITKSFMSSMLSFWVTYFHVDGFRVDAVSNMIYHLGNPKLGENVNAINFLRETGLYLFSLDEKILFIAEDSSAYPNVTAEIKNNGVGFNFKWDMGFMNDSLKFFKEDPLNRKYHHDKITFGLMYAYSEKFVLPYSHDEVVHGKGSLINKMSGDYFQKFANLRLLMTMFMTRPGKKLLFMGSEFAQFNEWNFKSELDWNLYQYDSHAKYNVFFRELTKIYVENSAFHLDEDINNFKWLVVDDRNMSVFSYCRIGGDSLFVVVLNMTPVVHEEYKIPVPFEGTYTEILNSDKIEFYGSNQYNAMALTTIIEPYFAENQYIKVKLGPLTGMILKFNKTDSSIKLREKK